jgi:hypothetical protein
VYRAGVFSDEPKEQSMRRAVLASLVGVLVVGVSVWWLTRDIPAQAPSPTAPADTADEAGAPVAANRAATAVAVAPASPAAAGLPPLDCALPETDVLRIGAVIVKAGELCLQIQAIVGPQTSPPSDAWQKQARQIRDQWVQAELVRQALHGAGGDVTEAEVDAQVAVVVARAAAKPGAAPVVATDPVLRSQIRARLELAKWLAIGGVAEPTESDLRNAYALDPDRYGQPAKATLLPFVLRVAAGADAAKVEEAKARADQFYGLVVAGTEPAEAAKTTGLAPLPAFDVEQGGVEPQLVEAALVQGAGKWLAPMQTKVGWVVARVQAVQPGAVLPFDQVRDRVKAMLAAGQGQQEKTKRLAELLAGTQVVDLVGW